MRAIVLKILLLVFVLGVLFTPKLREVVEKHSVSLGSTFKEVLKNSPPAEPPLITHFTKDEIISSFNQTRGNIGLSAFIVSDEVCQPGKDIFAAYTQTGQIDEKSLKNFCPSCRQKAYIAIGGNYSLPGQTPWMEDESLKNTLSDNYTHACIFQAQQNVLVLFGDKTTAKTAPVAKSSTQATPSQDFSESELWQALVDYRHAHAKPDLQQNESLCQYARERVAEHITLFHTKEMSDYQNQDKYPLDAHAGFMRDGDSGYLFEKTGFNVVAENLAFWPSAQYPHQVIEWGWDTSTEGHREAQLSTEYTHACLSGSQGFYVAIFARNQ